MSGEERSTIRAKPARDCTLRPDAHVNELSKLTVEEATASISHFLGTKSLWLEVFWNGSIWFQSSYEGPILSIFHSPRAAIGWDVDRNIGTRLQEYGCKCTIQCIQGFHSGCEVNSGYFAVLTKVSNHLLREWKGFACISSRTSIGKSKVNCFTPTSVYVFCNHIDLWQSHIIYMCSISSKRRSFNTYIAA